jgi:glycosyltransferase involved in cell wall biosynthesis
MNNKKIFMYPGTINRHQGVDLAVRAFHLIRDKLENTEFHIYGKGPDLEKIIALINELDMGHIIKYHGWISTEEITLKMASAFCAIVPKRSEDFGNEAFSTKIMEFMALGVPVIASNTRIDKYYFNDTIIKFFESGNEKDLADKILYILNNPLARKMLIDNSLKFVGLNNWEIKQKLYFDIIDSFKIS